MRSFGRERGRSNIDELFFASTFKSKRWSERERGKTSTRRSRLVYSSNQQDESFSSRPTAP